jgi:hypothetical protein
MNVPLTKEEKLFLRKLLTRELVRRAVAEVLGEVWKEQTGKTSMEESAMAYQFNQGASSVLNKLYGMAELPPAPHVMPRRLNHNA